MKYGHIAALNRARPTIQKSWHVEMYQVADNLSHQIIIAHDVVLCCFAISDIC